ncbi:MAG: TetR/AcrR family transcriptional regulator [Bacteroidia bacterium]|nr:TetR/AcrR family transcriptional regulator [Bacteroidia bacterium]
MRERILEAALRLFAQDGYENVSLRRLATEVGLSAASLYHYFPHKAALLEALAESIAENFERSTQEIVEKDWEVSHKFREFCVRHVRTLLTNPAQAIIFLREAPRHLQEPARSSFLERQRRYESRVEALIQEGMQKNLFYSEEMPRFLAISLLAALNASATWYQPGRGLTPEEIGHALARLFLQGLIRNW